MPLRSKKSDHFDGWRSLQVKPGTWDEKARTVEAVLATETPCLMPDYRMGCMVDEVLSMPGARFPDQVPLLDTHDSCTIKKQVGSTRNIRIEADEMIGTRHLGDTEIANTAASLIAGGHLTDGSIRYRYSNPIYVDVGMTATVNGRSYTPKDRPMRIAGSWDLVEDSLCSIGADPNAKNRSEINSGPQPEAFAAGENRKEKIIMNPFELWLVARGHDPKALDDTKRASLQLVFDNEKTEEEKRAKAQADDIVRAQEKARAEAVKYVQDVEAVCSRHGVGDLSRSLIEKNASMQDVNTAILARLEQTRKPMNQHVEPIADETDKFRSACIDGILLSRSMKIEKPADGADQLTRIGFHALARMCAERSGIKTSHMDTQNLLLSVMGRRVVGQSSPFDGSRVGMMTGDFTYILANVANKALMVGFNTGPATWRLWCSKGSYPDFKTSYKVRLSDAGQIPVVNSGGEITFLKLTDSGETIALVTRAANIGFTRQCLINDDKGAIDAFRILGNSVAMTTNSLPYAVLLANAALADTGALFNSSAIPTEASPTLGGHNNLATGGNLGAPTAGTVSAMEKRMLDMTTPAYNPMQLSPKFLLFGSAHKTSAYIMLNSIAYPLVDMSSGVANPFSTANSGIQPVLDTNITGTKWFLACDPNVEPTVEVAFLNGVEAPTLVETIDQTEILGTTYTCFYDVVSKALSYRGLQYNPGA